MMKWMNEYYYLSAEYLIYCSVRRVKSRETALALYAVPFQQLKRVEVPEIEEIKE